MSALAVLLEVLVAALLIAAVAVLSAAEAAVGLTSRSRARRLIDSERAGAVALDALMERPGRLHASAAVARALAYSVGGVSAGSALTGFLKAEASEVVFVAGAVLGSSLIFTLGEALPRSIAVHSPERVALASAALARRLTSMLHPIARALSAGWLWITGLIAKETVSDAWLTEDEYRVSQSDDAEVTRDGAEEAFIDAVVEFTTKIVREVMVPRTDMVCLEDTSAVAEALRVIEETGFSRLPVFHETLDDIRGVLYAKDLLVCVGKDSCPASIGPIAREVYFVPETKPVEELLVEMKQRKTHIALVADEYGGTAGLATIEDLLEEIVGEIFDEFDDEEGDLIREVSPGRYFVRGDLHVDDLCKVINVDLPHSDAPESLRAWFERRCKAGAGASRRMKVAGLLILQRGENRFEILVKHSLKEAIRAREREAEREAERAAQAEAERES